MSKHGSNDNSLAFPLVVKFVVEDNTTRTLSASQPRDGFQTYVALGSYKASVFNGGPDVEKTLSPSVRQEAVVTTMLMKSPNLIGVQKSVGFVPPRTVTVTVAGISGIGSGIQKVSPSFMFLGIERQTRAREKNVPGPIEFYDGVINPGLGEWSYLQGKRATLKINKSNGKSRLIVRG
jgi:hypothetical protein